MLTVTAGAEALQKFFCTSLEKIGGKKVTGDRSDILYTIISIISVHVMMFYF